MWSSANFFRDFIFHESGVINLDTHGRFGLKFDDNTFNKTKKN